MVALRIEDLKRLPDGAMLAIVRRAKNDPFGDGREGYVSKRSAALLDAWLAAADIRDGCIFRRILWNGAGPSALPPTPSAASSSIAPSPPDCPPPRPKPSPATPCAPAPPRI
ncbi:hypothetical protein ABB55_06260 [Prosthecomicrobium hirschii]|uniref:Uncharacterized protein n=1 Tax=Prosthecodimorpha hirschii TaxID=665126 RepID=A0A0P6VIE8_9HYPH|nr:hypothetical protein [Prosthecomicrobium hirschii]KPL51879.1 hypothetical protein ABB55_06260 [Prosthecomicrobium hirschii]